MARPSMGTPHTWPVGDHREAEWDAEGCGETSSTQNAPLHPWVCGRRLVTGKLRLAVERSLPLRRRGPSWLDQSSREAAAHRAAVSTDK